MLSNTEKSLATIVREQQMLKSRISLTFRWTQKSTINLSVAVNWS